MVVDCPTQLLSVLGFSFVVVFHDKAKRTQQRGLWKLLTIKDWCFLKLCWIPSSDIWTQDESRVHQDLQVIWRTGGGQRVCHFDNLVEGRHFVNQASAWVSIVFANNCFKANYLATSFWEASPSPWCSRSCKACCRQRATDHSKPASWCLLPSSPRAKSFPVSAYLRIKERTTRSRRYLYFVAILKQICRADNQKWIITYIK